MGCDVMVRWDEMRVLSLLLDTHSRYGVIAVTVTVPVLACHSLLTRVEFIVLMEQLRDRKIYMGECVSE